MTVESAVEDNSWLLLLCNLTNGLLSKNNSNGYLTFHYNNIGSTIVLTNEEGEVEEQYTYGPYGEILSGDTSKTPYLYNGMYGVSTDANGLYYMRARYYNVSIKRFINQDIVNGSITNSQSLNKYSYVQGNPISLTDPFGLSPNISISGIGHAALDLLGIIPGFDFCDAINTAWYLKEGDYENAALSAAACIPLLGSVVGNGLKWGAKGVANAEKVADTVKLGSRIVGDGGALLLSGGQAVESAKQVYTNITNGEGLTWKNAVDVITLGISVAGMGMAGASIAKSGKSLKAMYKGETAVSNVATSNATKGVSQARENAGQMKMDLQLFGGKSSSGTDFYVTPSGDAIPAMGYRYSARNITVLENAKKGKIMSRSDGTYFSFDKYNDAIIAQGKLQIPYRPEYRISFDTIDIIEDINVPYGKWGKASYLEPITKDYKNFGPGKATQAITYSQIDSVKEIYKMR